jgi:DNA repair exonuclease SbcCD ATPase subunit
MSVGIDDLDSELQRLQSCLDDHTSLKASSESIYHYGDSLKNLRETVKPLRIEVQDNGNQLGLLEEHIATLLQLEAELKQAETEAEEAHTSFHQKTKGQRCPLCQHPM